MLDELAAEVPLDAPWTAPRAAEWDAITAGAWLEAQGLAPVAPHAAGDLHGRHPRGADGRGVLPGPAATTCRPAGSARELFAESEGGAQTTRFVGGTSQVPLRLAAQLTEHIVLDSPVQLIEHGARLGHRALPRRPGGPRPAGDRGRGADAGRPDHVRPAAARGARPADPAHAAGVGDEGVLRLRRAVLAGRRPERAAHLRPRPGPDVQRHLPGRRRARPAAGLPGGRAGPHVRPLAGGGAAGRADRRAGPALRPARRAPGAVRRRRVGRAAVDPRLLQREPGPAWCGPTSGTR